MKQITIFTLDDCLFGVESAAVYSIQPAVQFTKMPQQDDLLLLGIMRLNDGSFVHVINSDLLLGIPVRAVEQSKIISFQNGANLMGLIVGPDVNIATIDEGSIEAALPISKIKSEYLIGTVTNESGVVLLLDMGQLLNNAL